MAEIRLVSMELVGIVLVMTSSSFMLLYCVIINCHAMDNINIVCHYMNYCMAVAHHSTCFELPIAMDMKAWSAANVVI